MGTETQPYLTGKRVYNGGSSAPNTGATSKPQGYVQRELAKRNGGGEKPASAMLKARDMHQQEQQPSSNPIIPMPMTPIGNSGLMKDPTGRLHYGYGTPQAAPGTAGPPAPGPTTAAPTAPTAASPPI